MIPACYCCHHDVKPWYCAWFQILSVHVCIENRKVFPNYISSSCEILTELNLQLKFTIMQSESMTFCRISKLSNIIVNAKSQNKGKLNVKKYNSHFPVVSVPEMWCQWLMWCQSLTWCLPESEPAAPQRELRQDAQTKVIEYWSQIMNYLANISHIYSKVNKLTFSHLWSASYHLIDRGRTWQLLIFLLRNKNEWS